jgi:hypothetical protein
MHIRHSDVEKLPRPGVLYRCHVCRLELIVDPRTERLTVSPVADDGDDKRPGRPR